MNAENVANQQKVVLQERAEGYAEPNGRDWDVMSRLIYPTDHPYHNPVIGTVKDVQGFEVPAVNAFWKAHYTPKNAVLVLVGNITPAAALDSVRLWFSDVPAPLEHTHRSIVPAPSKVTGRAAVVEDDVETRTAYWVWPTVEDRHPDAAALDILSSVLSGGHGTRLDDALYYDRALASDVGAFVYPQEIAGNFMIHASSPTVSLARLQKGVMAVLDGLVKSPVTGEEVNRARAAIRATILDGLEAPEDVAERVADCWRLTGRANCVGNDWSRYQAVTPADVQRVATQYIVGVAPNTISNIPRGDAGALPNAIVVELP